MLSEAAIYVPNIKNATLDTLNKEDALKTQKVLQGISGELFKANVDIKKLAENMTREATTSRVQRYAVGTLVTIVQGKPVTHKTLLDSLFNTYAPALNLGLAQTAYNSLDEMKNAVMAGTVNVTGFLQGFSNGLSVITDSMEKPDFGKYGEEIPVDLVENFDCEYKIESTEQKISDQSTDSISDLKNVEITLKGHVKNEQAGMWKISDFTGKIAEVMSNKQRVCLRVGKSIFDNLVIISYTPKIQKIHDLLFEMKFKYDYMAKRGYTNQKKGERIMNVTKTQDLKNKASQPVYLGRLG